MAPTRRRDKHSTPILISSSPSSPRPSKSKVPATSSPQGIVKLPPTPFPALRKVENGKQTQQWVDMLSRNDASGSIVSVKLGRNGINDIRGEKRRSEPRPRRRSAGQVDEHGRQLPFNVLHHSMLVTMQKIMEEALFFWAKEEVPRLLVMAGWETPEAGELNWWLRTMDRYRTDHGNIPANAFSQSAGMNIVKLGDLLTRLHYVRHAAVHRLPINVSRLKGMLADAQLLTKGLRDRLRTNKLWAIAVALEADDKEWMEGIIAAPIANFDDPFDAQKFRTQCRPSGQALQQKENFQSSDRVKYIEHQDERGTASNVGVLDQRTEREENMVHERGPGIIKSSGDLIDLTMDSDDDSSPATNPTIKPQPTKMNHIIDLTQDQTVVLFRSPRINRAIVG